MPRSHVEILNPVPGGSRWTSSRRAQYFIHRGLAVMANGKLLFHGPGLEFRRRLEAARFEQAVAEGRGERVYWNGSRKSPWAMCRPGQARS
jgi:hypothetical protein